MCVYADCDSLGCWLRHRDCWPRQLSSGKTRMHIGLSMVCGMCRACVCDSDECIYTSHRCCGLERNHNHIKHSIVFVVVLFRVLHTIYFYYFPEYMNLNFNLLAIVGHALEKRLFLRRLALSQSRTRFCALCACFAFLSHNQALISNQIDRHAAQWLLLLGSTFSLSMVSAPAPETNT